MSPGRRELAAAWGPHPPQLSLPTSAAHSLPDVPHPHFQASLPLQVQGLALTSGRPRSSTAEGRASSQVQPPDISLPSFHGLACCREDPGQGGCPPGPISSGKRASVVWGTPGSPRAVSQHCSVQTPVQMWVLLGPQSKAIPLWVPVWSPIKGRSGPGIEPATADEGDSFSFTPVCPLPAPSMIDAWHRSGLRHRSLHKYLET